LRKINAKRILKKKKNGSCSLAMVRKEILETAMIRMRTLATMKPNTTEEKLDTNKT
jgi:hypothetical protein